MLAAVATITLAAAASGCAVTVSPPGPAPLRYRDPVFSAVSVTSNLTYGTAVDQEGNTDTLQLDMYAPKGDTDSSRPAIVWVHGGSFCCLDKTSPELVDEATTFAKEGYVNVSINYRLVSGRGLGRRRDGGAREGDHPGHLRRADRGALVARQRQEIRDRSDADRHRGIVGRRDHGDERRLREHAVRPDGK